MFGISTIDFSCEHEGYVVTEMNVKHKKYKDYKHSRQRIIKSLSDLLRNEWKKPNADKDTDN